MKVLERFGGVAGLAGVFCYFLAFGLVVLAPELLTNQTDDVVVTVAGETVKVPPYTEAEAAGRQVFIENVCWHCHSQFVRPVCEEWLRYGPVSQPGESAVDRPHLFGTRRIGPDLAREGGLRSDDWHIAHLIDPRSTVKQSVMPGFTWLFKPIQNENEIAKMWRELDSDGDGIVSPKWDDQTYWPPTALEEMKAPEIDRGGVPAPPKENVQTIEGRELWPESATYRNLYAEADVGDNLITEYDFRKRPTDDALNLVKYLQRLGTAIGPWRRPLDSGTPTRGSVPPMIGVEAEVEVSVDGAMRKEKVSIPGGQMPLRAYEARRHGNAWDRASEAERQDSLNHTRRYEGLMAAWRKANPEWDERLTRGKELYDEHCASCHGDQGRGNGTAAPWLIVRPRDFTRGMYRYRSTAVGRKPLDGDLYRSIHRGLWGTAMPSWRQLGDESIWLLVDYVKSLFETVGGDRGEPFDDVARRIAVPELPPLLVEEYDRTVLRGKAVYQALKCSNCHGSEGRGDGPGWASIKNNGGLVRPRDLRPRGEGDQPEMRLRGGATAIDLWRTIFTGLDGTGMPAHYSEIVTATEQGAELERLRARKAPAAEIEAAAKAARRNLFQSLKDPALLSDEIGVKSGTDENGNHVEYLESLRATVWDPTRRGSTFGDDWALVLFVMDLMKRDPEAMVWPKMVTEED